MMKKWLIKEIGELTQTSTRMLRHYDKIGLLEPSFRQENGYRCYTEQDLLTLQQITALKYFGFSLNQIKDLLQSHTDIYAHLKAQHEFVKQQKVHLQHVEQLLGNVLKNNASSKTPSWQILVSLIEGYQMKEQLREKLQNSWAGQNLTAAQFEYYLSLYERFPEEYSERDKLVEKINQKQLGEPSGPEGLKAAKFMMDVAKKIKAFHLENSKFAASILKSIKSGQLTNLDLTPEGAQWISQAFIAYILQGWQDLYQEIKNAKDLSPKDELGKQLANKWRELIEKQLEAGNREFSIGVMLWQELARQDHKLKSQKKAPSPKEMIKPYHLEILFDPDAMAWMTEALESHPA